VRFAIAIPFYWPNPPIGHGGNPEPEIAMFQINIPGMRPGMKIRMLREDIRFGGVTRKRDGQALR
jgi:hypothetical protein